MPKLTITIRGVALIYQKDDQWKILLPFGGPANCHLVKFVRGGVAIPVAGTKGKIYVTATSSVAGETEGDLFENFVDLTNDDWGHSSLQMMPGWDEHTVLMTIQDGVAAQDVATHCRWGIKEGTDLKQDYDLIACSAQIVLEADDFTITIPGVDGFPLTINSDDAFTIDNTCGQYWYDESGDLKMLYEYVIFDPTQAGREFSIERHPDDQWKGKKQPGILATTDNPLLNQPGLPCNVWVASKSDGLE